MSQMPIDFPGNGEVGIGDIQHGTYTSIGTGLGGSLRDMALRPDGSGMLIADTNGTILEYHVGSRKQIKTFTLPGGSDGMAYDEHHHTLDLAIGSSIVSLDPKTGATGILIDGIATPDGLAIDRQGNLFIADNIGILELNTGNQLLIVGTNTSSIVWDDVAPLSGSGAASY